MTDTNLYDLPNNIFVQETMLIIDMAKLVIWLTSCLFEDDSVSDSELVPI